MWWNQNVWQAYCKENLLLPQILSATYQIFTAYFKRQLVHSAGEGRHQSLHRQVTGVPWPLGSQRDTQVLPGSKLLEGRTSTPSPPGCKSKLIIYHKAEQAINSQSTLYQKITKRIDFVDLKLLNLTTHTGAYSAWNPCERNPYVCGECKGEMSWLTVKVWMWIHTSTTFQQFSMGLFTAQIAFTRTLNIDGKSWQI